jgi:regulator of sigma E protease
MMTAIIFLIVLGLLVFVHELGHFTVARRNGIKAEEFGFGFPPRLVGAVKDAETGKWRTVWGNEEVVSPTTVYSLNWIPLGGFVRIKGEDGTQKDPDSFATKPAWVRVKVLAAGVAMNFLLAWLLISVVLMAGFPQAAEPGSGGSPDRSIQISEVRPDTPAEAMGLQFGDVVISIDGEKMGSVAQVQEYIALHKGREIAVEVERGGERLTFRGAPRTDYPPSEGSLGIGLGETEMVSYPWYRAFWEGAKATYGLTVALTVGIFSLLGDLVTGNSANLQAVSGPVGIAHLTGQVTDLGLVYLLYFTAILSINLGIINILPFPALDGGRILFVLIEAVKGSPVSQRLEGAFHQVGFLALLLLMVLVTVHDFSRFRIMEKLFGG